MVTVVGQEGLGDILGQGLGGGLSQGISAGLSQMLEQKQKKARTDQIMQLLGIGPQQSTGLSASAEKPQASAPAQRGMTKLTPAHVVALSSEFPEMGPAIAQLYNTQQKEFEKTRSFESARSDKYLDQISTMATNLPERKIAIDTAINAVKSGQMQPFGGDFVADILNLPQLRTASGAALSTAAKQNLIGSLSQVSGGRPNQFIEQQITNAFARAGQSEEANLSQLDIMKAKLEIDEKLAEATDRLATQYKQQLGYVPESIDREVRKEVKPYAEQRMNELAYDLRQHMESEMGVGELKKNKPVPKGTPLTLKKAKILYQQFGNRAEEKAKELGYTIPGPEIYSR